MAHDPTVHRSSRCTTLIVVIVGYTFFYAALPSGHMGCHLATQLLGSWNYTLVVLGVYNMAGALACMLLHLRLERGLRIPKLLTCIPCYACLIVCTVACYAIGPALHSSWIVYPAFMLTGFYGGLLRVVWTAQMLTICQKQGIAPCAIALCASVVAARVVASGCVLIHKLWQCTYVPTALTCSMLLISLICCLHLDRSQCDVAVLPAVTPEPRERYQLAPHAIALLACFGIFQGVSIGMSPLLNTDPYESSPLVLFVNALLLTACATFLVKWLSTRAVDRYGSLIRHSVAVIGGVLASMPLLTAYAPYALPFLSSVALGLMGVAMALFSICICYELNYRPASVIAANIGVYAASSSAACLIGIPLSHAPIPGTAVQAFVLVAVFAALATIPTLPSSTSKASVFTLDKYPENETPRERLERNREAVAIKYELTPREREVLALVLEGAAHKEVAQQLQISRWTARDYLGSIYKKTQTHSVKELADLVNSCA